MSANDNRQNAHSMIDHVFHNLLPAHGMAERPEQVSLSHLMLDAMEEGSIALCDAGTGIGKTYSYLAAGVVFLRFRTDSRQKFQPVLISTSSIALQNAVQNEYLPFLSNVLMEDGLLDEPLAAVIRKGKSHYVCDQRLERRLGQLDLSKKNWRAGRALLSLREQLDMDAAVHLSGYDRERVCVPQTCDCGREDCRYLNFLADCSTIVYPFQICNHNLLLADAIHRGTGRNPILPDACAVIIDETHKLPDAARQMFGTALEARDIQALIRSLRREKFLLAAETLAELSAPLLRLMSQPFEDGRAFNSFARLLIAPTRNLHIIRKQLHGLLSVTTHKQMKKLTATMELFISENASVVFYAMEDQRGGTMLCAAPADLNAQLRGTLWDQAHAIILTSGTLAVDRDFRHFKEETGLLADGRIVESVSASPFDYKSNCLLYLPLHAPEQTPSGYYDELAAEIAALLDACWGHALVLFTSYAAMSAIKERLAEMDLPWTIFTLGRNAVHTTQQFKASPGSVLLATGAAWEGFDFPGDCVSLLVIPRLPFAHPDALKEKKRAEYPNLRSFIRAVVVPEMQIKLKQGFGRAIRTETDTCVVAILDERAAPGQRYYQAMRAALPEMRETSSLEDVVEFIYQTKSNDYFCHENASDV
ncbi:MAG: ATP-dependent DNA helicase [Oscillospiraceae bacterium]|nr:ATP-dependent DNA helicase [Oscillospiraceae bacterium]